MKHVVFYSGGAGSYITTRRIIDDERWGINPEDIHLVFTDTQIEDKTLYRFLIETFEDIFNISDNKLLLEMCDSLTEVYEDIDKRKKELAILQNETMKVYPNVHWLRYEINGNSISPWDIFYSQKFIGNFRTANCSLFLKQRMAKEFIKKYFDPKETILYMGIDWSEEHRTKSPIKSWRRQCVSIEFPLCEEPHIFKDDKIHYIFDRGITVPELYAQGFSHNNCGGFCVKAGQGHFKRLLEKNPKLYMYHEQMEDNLIKLVRDNGGEGRSMLKKMTKGNIHIYPLSQLRKDVQGGLAHEIDDFDIGGCGCFISDETFDNQEENFSVYHFDLIYRESNI